MKKIMILALLSMMILSACISEPETKNETINLEEITQAEATAGYVAGWLQMDGTACLCMQWSNAYEFYDCKYVSISNDCGQQAIQELESDVFCSICLQAQTKDLSKVRELIEAGGESDN